MGPGGPRSVWGVENIFEKRTHQKAMWTGDVDDPLQEIWYRVIIISCASAVDDHLPVISDDTLPQIQPLVKDRHALVSLTTIYHNITTSLK